MTGPDRGTTVTVFLVSNQEIARRLGITERTARTHVSNLLGKLHLASRTQAALLAQQEGLPALALRRHAME